MAKNFDDFVLWLRENPEYRDRQESALREFNRKAENTDPADKAGVIAASAMFAFELSELELRFYHEWANRL